MKNKLNPIITVSVPDLSKSHTGRNFVRAMHGNMAGQVAQF